MQCFRFSHEPIDSGALRREMQDPACGGYAAFEGWVRNLNEGRDVTRLEYEAFEPLAIKEGERILAAAAERFGVDARRVRASHRRTCARRVAVWVGVSSRHRTRHFWRAATSSTKSSTACRSGRRSTIADGDSGWVNCERCAAPAGHGHDSRDHAQRRLCCGVRLPAPGADRGRPRRHTAARLRARPAVRARPDNMCLPLEQRDESRASSSSITRRHRRIARRRSAPSVSPPCTPIWAKHSPR